MMIRQSLYRESALPVLEKGLDAYASRDKAIANNLANVATPRYKKIKVDFEAELKNSLNPSNVQGSRTRSDHLSLGRKELFEVDPLTYRAGDNTLPGEVNNVDIDMESAQLAENQIAFHYAIAMAKDQLEDMAAAVRGKSRGGR